MIIVGAGPAGLAVAAQLRQRGLRPTVLEQSDRVGGGWVDRWDSLRLHTARSLSGLPDRPIPRRYGRWVGRADYVGYLRDYAAQFEIRPEFGVRVHTIDRAPAGWAVHTSAGVRETAEVVIATGYSRRPSLPDWPGLSDYGRPLVHSVDYRRPDEYRGRRVLVVGAGNSAADIAAELADNEIAVQLAVRTPPNIVRRAVLGVPSQFIGLSTRWLPPAALNPMSDLLRRLSVPDLAPHGLPAPIQGFSQFERTRTVPVLDHGFVDRVRAGRIEVVPAVRSFTAEQVELADGRRIDPEAVIAATGFTPGLEPIVGHLGVLDERGLPRVRGGDQVPTAPGLFFVGITVELSGLLHEIAREARAIAATRDRDPSRS